MFLLLCLILYLFKTVYSKQNCQNDSIVTLNSDELIFFESPLFPQILSIENDYMDCSIKFVFKNNDSTSNTTMRGLLIITNTLTNYKLGEDNWNFYQPPRVQTFNNNSVIFYNHWINPYSEYPDHYYAYQGHFIFDDWGSEDCPLESISRVKPFEFMDEKQVIYLQSNFPNSTRSHPCFWQFVAPHGYGFKMVIQILNIINGVQITISNTTNIIQTERTLAKTNSYFNSDNHLKIYLSNSSSSVVTEFGLYLSIFKNSFEIVEGGCRIEKNGEYWGNMNLKDFSMLKFYGYKSNEICIFDLIVPSKTETLAEIVVLLEPYADYIEYLDVSKNEPVKIVSTDNNTDISQFVRFYANLDGSDNLIKWKFVSDGNINFLGFQITFSSKQCVCSNSTIIIGCSTDDPFLFVGPGKYYNDEGYQKYCGNLRCNYTLQLNPNCTKNYFYFHLEFDNFVDITGIFDIYRVYSNNITVLEFNQNMLKYRLNCFIPATANILIEIITNPNNIRYKDEVIFEILPTNKPKIQTEIILTHQNPYFGFDTNTIPISVYVGSLFTVEIESPEINNNDKNATIEIFTSDTNMLITLYENENLTETINDKNCFNGNSPTFCKIKAKQVAIVVIIPDPQNGPFLFFKSSLANTSGCAFKNNVFVLPVHLESDEIISETANSNKFCYIFVLLPDLRYGGPRVQHIFYQIKQLWTSSFNGTVNIYTGFDNTKLFLEFNAESAPSFNGLNFTSRIDMIQIPPFSGLMLTLDAFKDCHSGPTNCIEFITKKPPII